MVRAVEPLATDSVGSATFSHTITAVRACEKGGQQLHAVEPLAKMWYGQVELGTMTYNVEVGACKKRTNGTGDGTLDRNG